MKHSDVVLCFLVPTDENGAEAVEPTMGPLHDPTPRFDTGLAFYVLPLLTSTVNVSGKAELLHQVTDFVVVVTFVHAHPLRLGGSGFGLVDGNAFQGLCDHLHVVAVGSLDSHADGDTVGVNQLAALDAALGAIGGVCARF